MCVCHNHAHSATCTIALHLSARVVPAIPLGYMIQDANFHLVVVVIVTNIVDGLAQSPSHGGCRLELLLKLSPPKVG